MYIVYIQSIHEYEVYTKKSVYVEAVPCKYLLFHTEFLSTYLSIMNLFFRYFFNLSSQCYTILMVYIQPACQSSYIHDILPNYLTKVAFNLASISFISANYFYTYLYQLDIPIYINLLFANLLVHSPFNKNKMYRNDILFYLHTDIHLNISIFFLIWLSSVNINRGIDIVIPILRNNKNEEHLKVLC